MISLTCLKSPQSTHIWKALLGKPHFYLLLFPKKGRLKTKKEKQIPFYVVQCPGFFPTSAPPLCSHTDETQAQSKYSKNSLVEFHLSGLRLKKERHRSSLRLWRSHSCTLYHVINKTKHTAFLPSTWPCFESTGLVSGIQCLPLQGPSCSFGNDWVWWY